MFSKRRIYIWYFVLAFMSFVLYSSQNGRVAKAAGFTTIGSGTAASCQSNTAVNAFMNAVAAGGTIEFDCGPDLVIINVNTNIVTQPVVVNGNGDIVLSGESLRQIFYVKANGSLTLNNMLLVDGETNYGGAAGIEANGTLIMNGGAAFSNEAAVSGGAFYSQGTLTLDGVILSANQAAVNGGGAYNDGGTLNIIGSNVAANFAQNGAGLYNANGQLVVDRSAVRGNQASNIAAVYVNGPAQIINSTFTTNRALLGGALFLSKTTTIINSTFYVNYADTAGAIWKVTGTNVDLKNSIVGESFNTAGNSQSLNCDGVPMTSQGRNIISDGSCLPNPGNNGDLFNTFPGLGPYVGSPILGYVPLPNGIAVDFGQDCPDVDQRSYPRPIGGSCDAGSMELGWVTLLPAVIR